MRRLFLRPAWFVGVVAAVLVGLAIPASAMALNNGNGNGASNGNGPVSGAGNAAAAPGNSADAPGHDKGDATPAATATTSTAAANASGGGAVTSGPLTSPQPLSNADQNDGGANDGGNCGAYCSTRDGSASGNGNGTGQAAGKPCAGCVGKADNKNPPGQFKDGSDHNNGYECDGNHGIARTNPAHTGCTTSPPSTPNCASTGTCPTPNCTSTGTCPTPNCASTGTCPTPNCTSTGTCPTPNCASTGTCPTPTPPPSPDCAQAPQAAACRVPPVCVPSAANSFCSDVLPIRLTASPSPSPRTEVLGESFQRPSGDLPFTGTDVAALGLLAAALLGGGTALLVAARRRRPAPVPVEEG